MTQELVDGNTGVVLELYPNRQEVAEKVKAFMESKPKKVYFNKKRYAEFEDYQFIASFYGITCKTFDPKFVEIAGFHGFHAKALLLDEKLNEVGRAEAYCMDDEPNWKHKPLFQLASQAQSRAAVKAFANRFRPITRLAGAEGTPFEEVEGMVPQAIDKPHTAGYPPGIKAEIPSDEFGPIGQDELTEADFRSPAEMIPSIIPPHRMTTGKPITEKQQKFLFAIWKSAGRTPDELLAHLEFKYGVKASKDLTNTQLQEIVQLLEAAKK